jgi:hypothetical protein
MAETALREHGAALQQHGPSQYRRLLRLASLQAFLVGDRKTGMRYGLAYARLKRTDPVLWLTIILGLVGPRSVAYGVLLFRLLTQTRLGPLVQGA